MNQRDQIIKQYQDEISCLQKEASEHSLIYSSYEILSVYKDLSQVDLNISMMHKNKWEELNDLILKKKLNSEISYMNWRLNYVRRK